MAGGARLAHEDQPALFLERAQPLLAQKLRHLKAAA
jgi:hypothetical protein